MLMMLMMMGTGMISITSIEFIREEIARRRWIVERVVETRREQRHLLRTVRRRGVVWKLKASVLTDRMVRAVEKVRRRRRQRTEVESLMAIHLS